MAAPDQSVKSSACHCVNIRRASHVLTEYYGRMLRQHGLTLNQYSLLSNIRQIETCSVSELSRWIRLDRTTLVRNLKPLFAEELIHNSAKAGPRNSSSRLPLKGAQMLVAATHTWERRKDLETYLGTERFARLTAVLLQTEKINDGR